MKKCGKGVIVFLLAVVFCMAFTFAGCSACGSSDKALETKIIADFTKTEAERAEVFESDGWENGEPFNTWWVKEDVKYNEGYASLYISEKTGTEGETAQYYGGEMRTTHYYGYGDFKVRMKPAAVAGTASTFFTCTGPYDQWYNEDGEVTKSNDHDEIDIEFLGKDTTKVQFNYFASGVGGHEYMYDLGFDASKEYHDYGFRWTENDITWFVDDKPVYKVERKNIKEGEAWPEEPGRVIMNYWCGTEKAEAWMGEFNNDYNSHADYQWISSTAEPQADPATTKPGASGGDGEQESEPIPTDIMWSDPTLFDFVDNNSGIYTVTPDTENKKATITYTDAEASSWTNVKAVIGEEGSRNNYVGLTLTSKTDNPISVRVNTLGNGERNLAKKSYVSAGTTAIDGGATCIVPANGSIDIVVYYEGALTQLQLMIDSTAAHQSPANTLEVSNMKLGLKGELVEDAPSEPSKNTGIYIGEELMHFTSEVYTIESSADNKSMTASYTDVLGNNYDANIVGTDITFGTSNTFTFKVKNNGTETAKIRADIKCTPGENSTPKNDGYNDFCNTEAVYENVVEFGDDYAYGGADWFKVAAGETATVTITFNAVALPNNIMFYIDSSTYDDTTTHTGSVVFSDMALSTVTAAE